MDPNSSKNFERPAVFRNWQGSESSSKTKDDPYGQGNPEPVFKIGMVSFIQMG